MTRSRASSAGWNSLLGLEVAVVDRQGDISQKPRANPEAPLMLRSPGITRNPFATIHAMLNSRRVRELSPHERLLSRVGSPYRLCSHFFRSVARG